MNSFHNLIFESNGHSARLNINNNDISSMTREVVVENIAGNYPRAKIICDFPLAVINLSKAAVSFELDGFDYSDGLPKELEKAVYLKLKEKYEQGEADDEHF